MTFFVGPSTIIIVILPSFVRQYNRCAGGTMGDNVGVDGATGNANDDNDNDVGATGCTDEDDGE